MVCILWCTIVISICTAFLSFFKRHVAFPIVVIAVAGIVAAYQTYLLSVQNDKQMNDVDTLSKLNYAINKEVNELSHLNTEIGTSTETISKVNNELANRNLNLSDTIKSLIVEVNSLTASNLRLTSAVKGMQEKQEKENTLGDRLNLRFQNKPSEFILKLGEGSWTHICPLLFNNTTLLPFRDMFQIGINKNAMRIKISDNEILLTTKFFDTSGNLLFEINDNEWRVNRNRNKVNFDEKGVEFVDDKDNVIMSIDLVNDNTLIIRGLFIDVKSQWAIAITDHGFAAVPITEYSKVYEKTKTIKKLFKYTGKDWVGQRN